MNSQICSSRRCQPLFVCLGLIVIFSGCQEPAAPDYASLGLAEVSGTILLDGKPLADANVIFESPDKTYSVGRTNGQGKYKMMFNSEKSGVLVGDKIVRIQLGRFPEDAEAEDAPARNDDSELPASYNTQSQLKLTVIAGVHTFDFDLNSDGSTTSAAQ